jgi:two-component system CheB/CheR fusion protein
MREPARAVSWLADLAHALSSGAGATERVVHALAALRHVVPYDRCVLVNAAAQVVPPCVVVPAVPEPERTALADRARSLLHAVSDQPGRPPEGPRDDATSAHLAVPLVTLDEVAGVLLVERDAGGYHATDLQLLSVVASQLGAYLTALQLHEDERRATEALEEMVARRTRFLGILFHELRNPLAPIGNALHLLERAATGTEQAERARVVLTRQFEHLSRLVDDLLDATRVTTGKVHLERHDVDVAEVARRCVDDHRSLFAEAGVGLSLAAPGEPLWVDGDAVRLAQVVGNLLQNAAKFSNAGGRAAVRVARDGPSIVVSVRDDGAGIAPDILPRLFEPFAQGDETLDRSRGGLGLGLAVAKGLVELHGGVISAASEGAGLGAEFTVRLPAAPGPAAGAGTRDGARPQPAAGRRRVLVVEDNLDAAMTLQDVLELGGHEVSVAHDGPEGVARCAALDPEVVLCDIGLPGMSGYDVARAIRAAPGGASRLVLALTGYGLDEDRHRVAEAGFDGHLVKPVPPERLEEALRTARQPADERERSG